MKRKDWETNRDASRRPKMGKFWCWSCDMYFLGEGEKCPVCKQRNFSNKKGRNKK
jgi:hypothetical protein